ncbi:MAG: cation:proton antiporter [Acutalibacteraceae bacterium]|nr:cation:proton antiporter [Acutalibacteraceae bacterium]
MSEYMFILNIAIILISTKIFGLIFKKFHMPQVVGALLAGLILGPALLNVLQEDDFITKVSSIGVIVLMFAAGLETDIKEFKKTGKASAIIAIMGVVVPLAGGFAITYFMIPPSEVGVSHFLKGMFIGVILTATSVSITVETLKEMGKMNTRAGNAILGAAIIDDILGIIALTIISSFADSDVKIWVVMIKILGFFVFSIGVGFICYKLFSMYMDRYRKDYRRFVILAFTFCLLMSWMSEIVFGVADITGAYIAGLILSNTSKHNYLESRFSTLSYMLLSPIFFASIGLKVELPEMSSLIIIFAILLAVIAILSKMVGCGIGAKICGFDTKECLQIGAGMVSRGEVALIVADKGLSLGLMDKELFAPIVIVVVATTIIAPVILKFVFADKNKSDKDDFDKENLVIEAPDRMVKDIDQIKNA